VTLNEDEPQNVTASRLSPAIPTWYSVVKRAT